MAYFQKRRRYSKRKYNRKLSSRNIFGNRSAKSQANQINALKRSINRVARACRPEVKQYIPSSGNYTFSNSLASTNHAIIYGQGPAKGTDADDRIGNKINMIRYKLSSYFEYYNDAQGGYHNSESSGACIRIILLQRKDSTAAYNESIDPADVIANYASSGAGYTASGVSPLYTGIKSRFHVLYDKTKTITLSRNQILWKISVKPRPYIYNEVNQNHVNNVVALIFVSGLHADQDYTDWVTGAFTFKYVYSDA